MARRKSKAPRRSRGLNILRLGYAAASTELTMRAITGTGIMGFVTGKQDLYSASAAQMAVNPSSYRNPDKIISLQDMLADPSSSLMAAFENTRSNFVPLIIGSIGLNFGYKLGKKLLAPQRANINYLIRETVGKGVAYV